LLSSMMYANWKICEIHHELLRIAFNLDDNEQRRVISLRLICIWRRKWNMTDIKARHRLWFDSWERNYHQAEKREKRLFVLWSLHIDDYYFLLQDQSID
jgi:hypothetical protein